MITHSIEVKDGIRIPNIDSKVPLSSQVEDQGVASSVSSDDSPINKPSINEKASEFRNQVEDLDIEITEIKAINISNNARSLVSSGRNDQDEDKRDTINDKASGPFDNIGNKASGPFDNIGNKINGPIANVSHEAEIPIPSINLDAKNPVSNINGGTSFNITSTKQETVNSVTKVILYTYMRSGSTVTGELFARDTDTFYLFEPVDGMYSDLYGVRSGMYPLDIFYYNDGSKR